MALKTYPYDAAEYLDSPEMIAGYIKESFATGDKDLIRQCISDVARAKGLMLIEKETGIAREKLVHPDNFTAEISRAFNPA